MILFGSKGIEDDFKGFPGKTDPRLIGCLLQLAAMRDDLDFILISGRRTVEKNREVGGVPDSGHLTKPLTAFDMVIQNRTVKVSIDRTEKERIKSFLQFWWGDLFDFIIYDKDEHVHLEVDRPFRRTFIGSVDNVGISEE